MKASCTDCLYESGFPGAHIALCIIVRMGIPSNVCRNGTYVLYYMTCWLMNTALKQSDVGVQAAGFTR